MRILSAIKKLAISLCAIICGVFCYSAVATQSNSISPNNQILANAETSTSASIDWRGSYTEGNTLDYCYIKFAGFTTKDDYEGNANSDYVFQNILFALIFLGLYSGRNRWRSCRHR